MFRPGILPSFALEGASGRYSILYKSMEILKLLIMNIFSIKNGLCFRQVARSQNHVSDLLYPYVRWQYVLCPASTLPFMTSGKTWCAKIKPCVLLTDHKVTFVEILAIKISSKRPFSLYEAHFYFLKINNAVPQIIPKVERIKSTREEHK